MTDPASEETTPTQEHSTIDQGERGHLGVGYGVAAGAHDGYPALAKGLVDPSICPEPGDECLSIACLTRDEDVAI